MNADERHPIPPTPTRSAVLGGAEGQETAAGLVGRGYSYCAGGCNSISDQAAWTCASCGERKCGDLLDYEPDGTPLIVASSFCVKCGDRTVPFMNSHVTDDGKWTCQNAQQCEAVDCPVWANGSQDAIRCEEPAGHVGPHVGDGGDWSWNS